MLYLAIFLVIVGLLLFALLDCLATDASLCRNLPKAMWILLIVFLPTGGSIAWLLLGRPQRTRSYPGQPRPRTDSPSRPRRPLGPDDDPRFLASMGGEARRPAAPIDRHSSEGAAAPELSGPEAERSERRPAQGGLGTGNEEPGRNLEDRPPDRE